MKAKKKPAAKPTSATTDAELPELPKYEPYAAELCSALSKEARAALRAHITWYSGVVAGLRLGCKPGPGIDLFADRLRALISLRDVLDKVEKDSGIATYEMEVNFLAVNAASEWNATSAAAIQKAGA